MLIPAHRLLSAMRGELAKLAPLLADADTDGSAAMSLGHALDLLETREVQGVAGIRAQFTALEDAIWLMPAHPMLTQIGELCRSSITVADLQGLEAAWVDVLRQFQHAMITVERDLDPQDRRTAIAVLVAWEAADRRSQLGKATSAHAGGPDAITAENLTVYLRDRFADPLIEVSSVTRLAGGFGKETTIFAATGRMLDGEYVIRRDLGDNAGLDTACHRIHREYPVIRAAFEQGFPAPDALWLDTEHPLLPGGDFIVMRRSLGRIAGNFFGAKTEIPADLADILADKMAQLHRMKPMRELGSLTDGIRPELWDMSIRDCMDRYIRNWIAFYLREEHTPSPALMSLFGWLLDNVPDGEGSTVLVHGDIGFHNFLLQDGGMSALVDWEFAHVGDPADDLGYVKVTVGQSLDWPAFMVRYRASGGPDVDARAIDYYGIWAYIRNASGANLLATRLTSGRADDLKLAILPYLHVPPFIEGASALIDAYEARWSSQT